MEEVGESMWTDARGESSVDSGPAAVRGRCQSEGWAGALMYGRGCRVPQHDGFKSSTQSAGADTMKRGAGGSETT